MIAYGISQAGRSHIERGLPCQDSHYILPAQEEGTWILAGADGVGSAAHAEIGAHIAAREAALFCARCLPPDRDLTSTYSMVRTAMNYALKQVLRRALADDEPAERYDTTLTLAIYDGARVIYGHAGDGGLFALRCDGGIVEVTTPQHGPDGETVIPLSGGYTGWEIGTYPHDVAALLFATDGMRAALKPSLLAFAGSQRQVHARAGVGAKVSAGLGALAGRLQPGGGTHAGEDVDDPTIYTPLVRFFADPRGLEARADAGHALVEASPCAPQTSVEETRPGDAATPAMPAREATQAPLDAAQAGDAAAFSEAPATPDVPSGASEPEDDSTLTSYGVDPAAFEAFARFVAGETGSPVDVYYDRVSALLGTEGDADTARELARMRAAGVGERFVRAVRDDRTIAVIANPDVPLATSAHPYREPDWDALTVAWQTALY
ncbi:MAG: protein phosphatase 2C domain-containing protein, partial [Coriobacteriia bacterium]|nr:protein phosphatase 2C domain-containing protein [Coriobacteriia bacterium]